MKTTSPHSRRAFSNPLSATPTAWRSQVAYKPPWLACRSRANEPNCDRKGAGQRSLRRPALDDSRGRPPESLRISSGASFARDCVASGLLPGGRSSVRTTRQPLRSACKSHASKPNCDRKGAGQRSLRRLALGVSGGRPPESLRISSGAGVARDRVATGLLPGGRSSVRTSRQPLRSACKSRASKPNCDRKGAGQRSLRRLALDVPGGRPPESLRFSSGASPARDHVTTGLLPGGRSSVRTPRQPLRSACKRRANEPNCDRKGAGQRSLRRLALDASGSRPPESLRFLQWPPTDEDRTVD